MRSVAGQAGGALTKILKRPFRIFAGVKDLAKPAPIQIKDGKIDFDFYDEKLMPLLRIYLGESPQPFLLRWVGDSLWEGEPDADGFYNTSEEDSDIFLWGWTKDGYHLAARTKATIQGVIPTLKLVKTERPAQIRIKLADLEKTNWAPAIRAYGYYHLRTISDGVALHLGDYNQQLNMPTDDVMTAAQRVLGASIRCPLGGEYRRTENDTWISSAWKVNRMANVNAVPQDFNFQWLSWFKGLSLEFSLEPSKQLLRSRLEIDMQMK